MNIISFEACNLGYKIIKALSTETMSFRVCVHFFIVTNFIFAIAALLLHSLLPNVLVCWFIIIIKLHSFSLTLQERIYKMSLLLNIELILILVEGSILLLLLVWIRKVLLILKLWLTWKLLLSRKTRLIKIMVVKLI